MDRLLKKRFRDYYDDKHRASPGLAFEDTFPGAPPAARPAARLSGLTAGFGLAAGVLLAMGVLLFLQDGSSGRQMPAGLADDTLLVGMAQGLRQSDVLGLSASQATSLSEELDRYRRNAGDMAAADFASDRRMLLQTLLESPVLALSNEQAIAMTGLLSSWKPGGSAWVDDNSLAHYVADCSTYCHQPLDATVNSNAAFRGYLLECLDTRKKAACSAALLPGQAPENGLF